MKTVLWTSLGIIAALGAWACVHVYGQIVPVDADYVQKTYGSLPYHGAEGFISPVALGRFPERTTGGKPGFTRFAFASEHAPKASLPMQRLAQKDFPEQPDALAVYWLGHSSAILDMDGLRLAIDPVFDNAAFLPGIVRRYGEAPLKREALPPVDVVLITHDHYDHLEKATMEYLAKGKAIFVVPLGVKPRLVQWGVPADRVHELAWDQTITAGGLSITALTGVHYSGRMGTDRNRTLWASYAIRSKDAKVFWSGDTGYGPQFAEIGRTHGPFDLAVMEIDGWNAGWPNTHLFPEEVARASQELQAARILPVHWAVFDLALHPWTESIDMVLEHAAKVGIPVDTPRMGEKYVPGVTPTTAWWKGMEGQ